MSARYIRCTIREQIDRAKMLKAEIPASQQHAALERLAVICRGTLEKQLQLLERVDGLLDGGGVGGADAKAMRVLKMCTRVIAAVEGYGMPLLHCQSEQAVFLNDVLSAMHGEVGLPFPCPAVSCTSHEYYFAHPVTHTVHAPLSETAFLLHMPDFYHELGHFLFDHEDRGAGCGIIRDGMACATDAIDGWCSQLMGRMERESAPTTSRDGVKWMWTRWTSVWIQEAFCDLFALFAAGPAYAHSNLHLVTKTDRSIYLLNLLTRQDRPSGEARMRLLDDGMRLLGHEPEADRIRAEWGAMAQLCSSLPPGYGHASRPSCSKMLPPPSSQRSGGPACAAIQAGGGNGADRAATRSPASSTRPGAAFGATRTAAFGPRKGS